MESEVKAKIADYFATFPKREIGKGELLMRPDETTFNVYYLVSGHVREYAVSDEGVEITVHIYAPGSFFPMTSVIAGIPQRHYYETVTDSTVHVARRDEVLQFLKENPDALMDLTKRLLHGLDKLTARIEHLAYGRAHTRVSSILIYLARHFGHADGNKIQIERKFTHRDIAGLAAVTRETASRELEKLKSDGLVKFDGQRIEILDLEGLKKYVSS